MEKLKLYISNLFKKQENNEYVYRMDNIYFVMPTKKAPGYGYKYVRNKMKILK